MSIAAAPKTDAKERIPMMIRSEINFFTNFI